MSCTNSSYDTAYIKQESKQIFFFKHSYSSIHMAERMDTGLQFQQ